MSQTLTRRLAVGAALAGALVAGTAASASDARVGAPAPAFTATDASGKSVSLADYKGRTVVLEWTNKDCPFVRKHYGGNAMQALQAKWTGAGVVWLSVISSAPGEQGAVSGPEALKVAADQGAKPTDILLDPQGTVGRAYGAQTTPHMYVIRGDGTLAYMGGIDDKPSAKVEDLKTAKNYVDAALTEVAAGKPVTTPTARPYGCTVKYSS
jgi:peroxiredoxin